MNGKGGAESEGGKGRCWKRGFWPRPRGNVSKLSSSQNYEDEGIQRARDYAGKKRGSSCIFFFSRPSQIYWVSQKGL